MLKLEFELTEKDQMAFQMHYAKNAPSIKKSMRIQHVLIPIVLMIIPFFVFWNESEPVEWKNFDPLSCIPSLIMSIVWILFFPKYFYWGARRRIKKLLKDVNSQKILGRHIVVVTEDEITSEGPIEKLSVKLTGLEKIWVTEEYVFLMVGLQGIIVPRRAFPDRQTEENFINQCKENKTA